MDERLSEIVSGLRDAAEVGAEHALREFKARSFEVDLKPDGTSITTADEAVEQHIRAPSLLLEEVGGHWRSLGGTRPSFAEPRCRYSFCCAVRPELLEEILALVASESST